MCHFHYFPNSLGNTSGDMNLINGNNQGERIKKNSSLSVISALSNRDEPHLQETLSAGDIGSEPNSE